MRRHNSFLLRCWDIGSEGKERIEIEHIQSGTKTLAKSVMDAVTWICSQNDVEEQPGAPVDSEIGNTETGEGSG